MLSSLNSNNNNKYPSSEAINYKKRIDDLEDAIDTINETLAETSLTKDTIIVNNHLGVDTVDATTINADSVEAKDISALENVSVEGLVSTPKIGGSDGVNTLEVVTDSVFDEDVVMEKDLDVRGNITLANPTIPSLVTDNLSAEVVSASTKIQTPLVNADEAIITNARITNADIGTINNISASAATIDNLTSTEITTDSIESEDITTDSITSDTATIDTITSDSVVTDEATIGTIKQENRTFDTGKIEMTDLQAEGNFHVIKFPVTSSYIHLSLVDKTELDQYNEKLKHFDITAWIAEIGRSDLVLEKTHQNGNVLVSYAMNDSESIVEIRYDYVNKYLYIKTYKNGIIQYDTSTKDEIEVTYYENEFRGCDTEYIEYVTTHNQRVVLLGDNTTAYGFDIMGQMEAAVSPTYEIIDTITIRTNNLMLFDNDLVGETEDHSLGYPHDIVARLSQSEGDEKTATGWFRGSDDRQIIRTNEQVIDGKTVYTNRYEDTVTELTNHTMPDEGHLVDAAAVVDWNGKSETGNNITKLGTVDEGTWNAGNVTTPELTVNGTATINGDLIVSGSSYEEHTADLFIGADFITLRDGASAGLDTDERSGVLVENYDGNNTTLGVVTTNDGELRIGDIDIRKCYEDVDNPGTYYSDKELTTVVDVSSYNLFPVGDPSSGVQEYTYTYDDDTEPLLTRDEKSAMVNNAVLAWNSAGKKAYATGLIYDAATDTVNATNVAADNITANDTLTSNGTSTFNDDVDVNADLNADTVTTPALTATNAHLTHTTLHGNVVDSNSNNVYDFTSGKVVADVDTTNVEADNVTVGTNVLTSGSGNLLADGLPVAKWATVADMNAGANYVAMTDGTGKLRTVSGSTSMWIEG